MWQTQRYFFDTAGNLLQGRTSAISQNYVIKGIAFSFSSPLTNHIGNGPAGVRLSGTLAVETTIGSYTYVANTDIVF